jgi:hypothetical protein
MMRFKESFNKYFWFIGGFALGYTLISLGHAALPKRVTPAAPTRAQQGSLVSEIKGAKVNSPEFDQDFAALNQAEGKYAESWDQQQRLRAATSRSARAQYLPTKKKAKN